MNKKGVITRVLLILVVVILEWVTLCLSSQTYEVEVTVLNVQSYPIVGGNWEVRFATNGTINLTISAVDGTSWSNETGDEDLKLLNIKCDEQTLNYKWINSSAFIQDYSCNGIGYETSKVLNPGRHDLMFQFGESTAYAYNQAQNWRVQSGSFAYPAATNYSLGLSMLLTGIKHLFFLKKLWAVVWTSLMTQESL